MGIFKEGNLRSFHKQYLDDLNAYWHAANYLTVGQIYLKQNPLLRTELQPSHLKKRPLGHWGTCPGLNLIYLHLNRLIQDTKASILYVAGPGHGGAALRSCIYLEGTMSDIYPHISLDEKGAEVLMKEFSWPGGVPSHINPSTAGSIQEGGELGYALSHAYGAVLDNPDLITACVVGDGEAETGPLATAWHSNKFINPARDGAVLPILHLNGFKISGPTIFGRMSKDKLNMFFQGCGYKPYFIKGDDLDKVHKELWATLNNAYKEIQSIQEVAREKGVEVSPEWPMIILKTPKGWTGPKIIDRKKVEGTFRSHQLPISDVINNPKHFDILKKWLKSYEPKKLFNKDGSPKDHLATFIPPKEYQMSRTPHANGGHLLKDLQLPDFKDYAITVSKPGQQTAEATLELGKLVRDIFKLNKKNKNFRIFCPDETNANHFSNVFEVTERMHLGTVYPYDEKLSSQGRVMEVLSEHQCQGWLEGYLLTGRHGIFSCNEAFALTIDSMLNQHARWIRACNEVPWRKPIASLNYLLTSHVWKQDHNGYSPQGPGLIESILSKKSSVARVYLPPDANCLLSVADHCLRSKNHINLIISGKQPMPQWLDMPSAIEHCKKGASMWSWASRIKDKPDIILAAAGDTPTLEMMAANSLLQKHFEELSIQVVNVVDLFRLMPKERHPHGMSEHEFFSLFSPDTPVIFAFHGHPRVIHELVHKQQVNHLFHVHGYIEEGTATTPFDMAICNKISRFHLAMNAVQQLSKKPKNADEFFAYCEKQLYKHKACIYEYGEDLPEIADWK